MAYSWKQVLTDGEHGSGDAGVQTSVFETLREPT